jgi:uncharacterized protein
MRLAAALLALALAIAPAGAATVDEALTLVTAQKYAEAKAIAEELAAEDDPRALMLLGTLYRDGLGVPQSGETARQWFARAAATGNAEAMLANAAILLDDSTGAINAAEAANWLGKSADAGNRDAQYNLGLIHAGRFGATPEWPRALELFRLAAEQGLAEAQYQVGLIYLDGNGVAKDQRIAASWLSKAAVKGMPEAALEYGVLVMRGEGVEQNIPVGVRWLKFAAEHGHPAAQNRLARIFAAAPSTPQTRVEAATWNLIASKAGRTDASLDGFMAKLTPEEKQKAETFAKGFAAKTAKIAE